VSGARAWPCDLYEPGQSTPVARIILVRKVFGPLGDEVQFDAEGRAYRARPHGLGVVRAEEYDLRLPPPDEDDGV
jgi:hypothetical protein